MHRCVVVVPVIIIRPTAKSEIRDNWRRSLFPPPLQVLGFALGCVKLGIKSQKSLTVGLYESCVLTGNNLEAAERV